MKRLIAILLCVALLLALFSGCATTEPTAAASTEKAVITTVDDTEQVVPTQAPLILNWNQEVQFTGMSDASLPRYLEDTVYTPWPVGGVGTGVSPSTMIAKPIVESSAVSHAALLPR